MKNIVLYHANCLDGTCAAWVASQYLDKDHTTYIPVEYGKPLEHQIIFPPQRKAAEDITLYILDWCPEMQDLDKCCELFGNVILIDHHESAIKKLWTYYNSDQFEETRPANLTVFLAHNNEWSGAMGTAIWFHMNKSDKTKSDKNNNYLRDHWLIKAVDDRDRWQFKLLYTKEITEALVFRFSLDLKEWLGWYFDDEDEKVLISLGDSLIAKTKIDCERIITASAIPIPDINIVSCNCPYFLVSEVGNILAKDYRLAVLWHLTSDGGFSYSLRSNKGTKNWINCAKLAEKYKGGGHANAAGFKSNMYEVSLIAELIREHGDIHNG